MKRRIKFPLFLKDDYPVRNMDELRVNFDLPKLLAYYVDGRLVKWLDDHYEDALCNAVKSLKPDQDDFVEQLCCLLDIPFDNTVKFNYQESFRKNEKIKMIRQYTNRKELLENPDHVAISQEELEQIINIGATDTIWLIGKRFKLPVLNRRTTLRGINYPRIFMPGKSAVSFIRTDSEIIDASYDLNQFIGFDVGENLKQLDSLVFTQGELEQAIKDDTKWKIGLIGEQFTLPVLNRKVMLQGFKNPRILMNGESAISFARTDSKIYDASYPTELVRAAEKTQNLEALAHYENIAFTQEDLNKLIQKKVGTIYICRNLLDFSGPAYQVTLVGCVPNARIKVSQVSAADALKMMKFHNITPNFLKLDPGDIVRFANLEWIVLDFDADSTMLITKDAVGSMEFDKTSSEIVKWELSDLYHWLENFSMKSFSKKQKTSISNISILSKSQAVQYMDWLKTEDDAYMWLSTLYGPTFNKASKYAFILKTGRDRCRIIQQYERNTPLTVKLSANCEIGTLNVLTSRHNVRPVIWVKNIIRLLEQGEVTPCS